VDGHQIARLIGTSLASGFGGPEWGKLVERVSGEVQATIEAGGENDVIDTHTNRFRRSQNYSMRQGEHSVQVEANGEAAKMRITYTVMRVTQRGEYHDWCLSVTLDRVRIMEDADAFPDGAGDIYMRGRTADGYRGQVLNGHSFSIGDSDGRQVDSGDDFPFTAVDNPLNSEKILYFNDCQGLPPFLYIEVGVWDDDAPNDDEQIGMLPLMFTNRWLREHPGTRPIGSGGQTYYEVAGADSSEGKARIYLTLHSWDPYAAPD
jgi:hypothetical protein